MALTIIFGVRRNSSTGGYSPRAKSDKALLNRWNSGADGTVRMGEDRVSDVTGMSGCVNAGEKDVPDRHPEEHGFFLWPMIDFMRR